MGYSIAMCSYNGEKFIKAQLDSFMNQTVLPDELIICDDGSSDDTVGIINAFKANCPFKVMLIVNKSNLGVTKNFENACKNAEKEIIFFSDQDDIWQPDKAEKILTAFSQNSDKNTIFTDAVLFDDKGDKEISCWQSFGFTRKKKRVFNKSQLHSLLMGWFCTGATMAAKREFLMSIMPFPAYLLHDQWISIAASLSESLLAVEDKLIKYRQHINQVVGAKELSLSEKVLLDAKYKGQMTIYSSIKDDIIRFNIDEHAIKLIDGKIKFLQFRHDIKHSNYVSGLLLAIKVFCKGFYFKYSDRPGASFIKDVLIKDKNI